MRKKKLVTFIKYLALVLIALGFAAPLFWIILQSLKTRIDVIAVPPKIFFTPTARNYINALHNGELLSAIRDSLIIAGVSVPLTLVIGVPFAYALARFKFYGAGQLGFFVLSTMVLPAVVIIVPLCRVYYFLHLLDTYPGLILAHVILNIALVIWVMRSFFLHLPVEVEEAARVDGCSYIRAFLQVTLPMASGGLAAVTILSFIFSWNDLVFALTLASSNVRTVPVCIATEYVGFLATDWGGLSAAGMIVTVPSILLLFAVRKYLVRGLSLGAIK